MKIKKIVSAISALTIAVSAFASMAVVGNAAEIVAVKMDVVNQNFNDLDAINTAYAKWTADSIGTTDKGNVSIDGNVISLSANKGNNYKATLDLVASVGKEGETTTIAFDMGKQSNGYYVGIPFVFYDSNNNALFSFIAYSNGSANKGYYLSAGNPYTTYSSDFTGYTSVATVSHSNYYDRVVITLTPISSTSATVTAKVGSGNPVSIDLVTTSVADITKVTMNSYKNRSDGDQYRAWVVDNFVMNGYVNLYETKINVKDGSNNIITGATATIGDVEAVDGNDGSYVAYLPEGAYEYTVVKEGYPTTSGSYNVSKDNEENTIDLILTAGADVEISTVAGATVAIGETSETADADGKVVFNLEDGTYDMTVEADGYFVKTQELVVADGVAVSGALVELTKLYTVKYSVDSSKGTVSATSSVVGQNAIPVTVPSVTDSKTTIGGYAFVGWSATENGEIVDPATTAVESDTTYYAVFSDQITYSKKYYPIADSNLYGDVITDAEQIILKSGNYRGFMNFDVDTKNAVGATMNIYATYANRPNSGTRNYNITFDSTKRNAWNADTVASGDGWLGNVGGSKETLVSIVVSTPSSNTADTDVAGWYTGVFNSFSGINNLYVNTGTGAEVAFSSMEGSNPAYIEVFYTGELPLPADVAAKADDAVDFVEPGSDFASMWQATINGTGATYSNIKATVELNDSSIKSASPETMPTITGDGAVTVYVVVNKAKADIKSVVLSVE